MTVTPTDIKAAYDRIAPYLRRTPIMEIDRDEFGNHPRLGLKLELHQHSGAFKARGAFATLTGMDVPTAGVAAASGGNHGAAVAYAAMVGGVRASIFVPEIASPAKIAKIKDYGADVNITGQRYQDAADACAIFCETTGAIGIHAFDAPLTIAGQGTIALEWAEQDPDLSSYVVSVGGGGLIAGFAAWHGGDVQLIAAETEGTRSLDAANRAGTPTDIDVSGSCADSLGAKRIGTLPFELLSKADLTCVTITDEAVEKARGILWDRCRVLSEPGAAAALAAALSGQFDARGYDRIGVLICGGNTSNIPKISA